MYGEGEKRPRHISILPGLTAPILVFTLPRALCVYPLVFNSRATGRYTPRMHARAHVYIVIPAQQFFHPLVLGLFLFLPSVRDAGKSRSPLSAANGVERACARTRFIISWIALFCRAQLTPIIWSAKALMKHESIYSVSAICTKSTAQFPESLYAPICAGGVVFPPFFGELEQNRGIPQPCARRWGEKN